MNAATQSAYRGPFGWIRRGKDWVESLADRKYSTHTLFGLSFIESFIFPIPADVLLIALCVGKPKRSFWYAFVCLAGSVIGGLVGYGIGYMLWYTPAGEFSGVANFFFSHVPGFTVDLFQQVEDKFNQYAVETVLTASFTPIPYKLITITGGVFKLNVVQFFAASVVGRAARFFLVAGMFFFFGKPVKKIIDKYFEALTIAFFVLLIGGFLLIKYVI